MHLANFKLVRITNVHRITTKEIMAPFFFFNKIGWGKSHERDASFCLVLKRKAIQFIIAATEMEEIM